MNLGFLELTSHFLHLLRSLLCVVSRFSQFKVELILVFVDFPLELVGFDELELLYLFQLLFHRIVSTF